MTGFPLVYDDEVRIYENPTALERAFLVHEVVGVGSHDEAQAMALGRGFDPRKTAVIEESPPSLSPGSANEGSRAVIKNYGPNRVVVEVDAKRKGMLVLSDLYYPGCGSR